jgi:hypothetical protein
MCLKHPPTVGTTVTPIIELAISIYKNICKKAQISDGEEEATAKWTGIRASQVDPLYKYIKGMMIM